MNAEQICHAHRAHAGQPYAASRDEPEYSLCEAAAARLKSGALRPREVFNIVSLHGLEPGGYIGAGLKAYHRYLPSGRPEHRTRRNWLVHFFPRAPGLDACRRQPGMALDYAAFQWGFDLVPDGADEVLPGVPFAPLLDEIKRRVEVWKVPSFAESCYHRVIGMHGDATAADWVRQRWSVARHDTISTLVRASRTCLSPAERVEHCLAAIARIPVGDRDLEWLSIHWLSEELSPALGLQTCVDYLRMLPKRDVARCSRSLLHELAADETLRAPIRKWIEKSAFDHDAVDPAELAPHPVRGIIAKPNFPAWGQLACVCQPGWPLLLEWLRRGPPLSRVAIDALVTCGDLQPREVPRILMEQARPLRDAGDPADMTKILRAYAATESDPRIRENIGLIVSNWNRVIAGTPEEDNSPDLREVLRRVDRAMGIDPLT